MGPIPKTKNACVLRADYSDDAAWKLVRAEILSPVGEFRAYLDFVDDPQFDQVTTDQLLTFVPDDYPHSFLFVVDRETLTQREHPILVIDLYTERGRTFRVIPSEMWGIENNLSIANMDFAEFADNADPDGVFRGFPKN